MPQNLIVAHIGSQYTVPIYALQSVQFPVNCFQLSYMHTHGGPAAGAAVPAAWASNHDRVELHVENGWSKRRACQAI